MATIQEFEQKVWELEGIRIVLRGSEKSQIGEYAYQKAAQSNINITKWIQTRVAPNIGELEATVILGNGEEPHGRNLLRKARASYGD